MLLYLKSSFQILGILILFVGHQTGYRFFVMERMDSTISSAVPLLLSNKSSSKTINIGDLASKLLQCVQGVHETKNIIRDVKTENFMLTLTAGTTGSTLEKKLASRIRLIDLAMAAQWTTMYRETDNGDSLIGTPLYASLNVHYGKKTSFRDDLESLGYVIAEILIQLYAGDPSKQLPWSKGKSDEDIASMKRAFVEDEKSKFYQQLGNAKTIRVFSDYMRIVRGYSFKKIPDYDELSGILSKLTVPKKKITAASSKKKSAPTKRTRSQVSATTADTDDDSPMKVPRRTTRNTTKSMDIDDDEECPVNEVDQSFDETVYTDAHQELEDMDWEYNIADENENPKEEESKPKARTRARRDPALRRQRTTRSGKATEDVKFDYDDTKVKKSPADSAPSRLKRRGVRILCVEGPHKGESYEMEAGFNEIVNVGSKPSSTVGEVFALKKDKMLNATHVRLDLSINRQLTAVKVTDKSKGGTYVNRDAVKSTKAFINDTIKIGESSLKIHLL